MIGNTVLYLERDIQKLENVRKEIANGADLVLP